MCVKSNLHPDQADIAIIKHLVQFNYILFHFCFFKYYLGLSDERRRFIQF